MQENEPTAGDPGDVEQLTARADHVETAVQELDERISSMMRSIAESDAALVDAVKGYVTSVAAREERSEPEAPAPVVDLAALDIDLSAHDDDVVERISEELTSTIGEQLQLLYERLGIEARSLADMVHKVGAQTGAGAPAAAPAAAAAGAPTASGADAATARLIEERVMGLARLIRSDSESLHRRLLELNAAQTQAVERMVDERLARMGERIEAVPSRVETIATRIEDVNATVDRNMMRLSETIDAELAKVGQMAGERAAEAAGAAISGHIDSTAERLSESAEAVEASRVELERMHGEMETMIGRHLDQRIGGLAKMIRSDNQVVVERMGKLEGDESGKQTLRAVKELQANLASELLGAIDRKMSVMTEQMHRETQTMVESFAKSSEVLGRRLDRLAQEVPSSDVQTAMERMGDAMHALATRGRGGDDLGAPSGAQGTIEEAS
jgi:hypothetical protein